MTTVETLSQLYPELAAPSTTVFMKALRARGISAREKDVREFISSKSDRQILQKGVSYSGKIVAFYPNDVCGAQTSSALQADPQIRAAKNTHTSYLFKIASHGSYAQLQ